MPKPKPVWGRCLIIIGTEGLAKRYEPRSISRMIRPGFLDPESRHELIELARDGLAAHRLARRANALVLLDDGMSCEAIARVLLLDDDTIRTWHRLYLEEGIEGLASFGCEGRACRLSDEQQDKLKAWITETLPRTTREVGAWTEQECGIAYQGRSGLTVLLHRLGMEHRKPMVVSGKLDPEKQAEFIKAYEDLPNPMGDGARDGGERAREGAMKPCCSLMRCIQRMRCDRPAAGAQRTLRWPCRRPAAGNG